jgi:hypothetical protein
MHEQAQDMDWSLDSVLNNLGKHVPRFVDALRAY